MKRTIRDRRLTQEEANKYQFLRDQIAKELPDLINRHQERMADLDHLDELVLELKAAREAKGLSLSDLTELTGIEHSTLVQLEAGHQGNPTVDSLVRYAEAVGKRLVFSLADL